MPIYEYRCNHCRRRVAVFVRDMAEPQAPRCPRCQASDLTRLLSSFSIHRSGERVYEDILSDANLVRGLEGEDPRAVAEWSRRMGHATGEELGPDFDEMVERMERGEMPGETGDDGDGGDES